MSTSTIQEIKQELGNLPHEELKELCLRLARFKKENKELLHYLLFEVHDPHTYTNTAKTEMEEGFSDIPLSQVYFTKKRLRKILNQMNKRIKYTGSKEVALELTLHFCTLLNEYHIPFKKYPILNNIRNQQLKKINTLLGTVHEDLQYDYRRKLESL
jgi:hypothetical protein